MTSTDDKTQTRIALVMRSVRSALGYNQVQFAELIGSSKPTIARIETLEMPMKDELYSRMVERLDEFGIKIDSNLDGVSLHFDERAIAVLEGRLHDTALRRPDRKK
ncbi:helix-turn-helix domain-containing protein [Alcaligenes faecalis]|uniref:helix-turn-helix domain-containing protein n=1 Tax=Alcaligenes faecalis TaxID=511 RepID=UPI0005A64210|nr:helix-turn-helix transcriptional regulator [Alcaligenes faecalis]ATH99126.1 XRE family transcriptional regulator [Alcaligenes faecalis]AYZ91913.1 XRE family transcriptional regulator [Alcaligenes faecalis]MCX5595624.1 helix-turn-helix transcriptional regulator [Alcaligenes faecalis]QQC32277.1 helix-turn-helix transcriptional regulator [Alcaligenes faecalis]CAJ0900208.1 XRE family transcriptional regulator [Alcaligenes faecalis subsp. faecalis]